MKSQDLLTHINKKKNSNTLLMYKFFLTLIAKHYQLLDLYD